MPPISNDHNSASHQATLWQSVLHELQPFEGRLAMAWRTAAVCALTAMVFMTFEVPLVAIGCYLIMFLAKPTAQENVLVAIGITVVISMVVVMILFLTRLAIEVPMWRMIIIVLGSYIFLFIGAASVLGPAGNIVALVIGFIMTLLPYVPFGEVATRGILYAWLMVLIPMGVVVVFHTVAGQSARSKLVQALAARLHLISHAIEAGIAFTQAAESVPTQADAYRTSASCVSLAQMRLNEAQDKLMQALREGNGKLQSLHKLVRLFHLAPRSHASALSQAVRQTQDLLVALAGELTTVRAHEGEWQALADQCKRLATLLESDQLVKAITLTRTHPVPGTTVSMQNPAHRPSETLEPSVVADRKNLEEKQDLQNQCEQHSLELQQSSLEAPSLGSMLNQLFIDDSTELAHASRAKGASRATTATTATTITTANRTSKAPRFFKEDAWRNPDYSRFAIKTTAAAVLAYIIYTSIQWDGIHTAMITCYVAALGTTGETVHKLTLRIVGCLIGAAMGIAALAFLIPYMTSVGQLMVLVFGGVLIAAWVSSGSERISYAGIQIGLAFLMTVLQDFRPEVSMSVAADRIYGILLGNALLFIVFTRLWPVTVITATGRTLKQCRAKLDALIELVSNPGTQAQHERRELVNTCLTALGQAREALVYNRFEPGVLRANPHTVRQLRQEISLLEKDTLALAQVPLGDTSNCAVIARVSKQLLTRTNPVV